MCYEAITRPDRSSLNIVRNGKTARRKQRDLCKGGLRQFIRDYTYLGCVGAVRALVVPLTINGSGVRDISRVLLLSLNTVFETLPRANFRNPDANIGTSSAGQRSCRRS